MKMFQLRSYGLVLALGLCLLRPAAAQQADASAPGRHSLWKMTGPSNTVYLLGSIHLLKKDNYPLPAQIEAAFSNAQLVVFETDFAKMDEPKAQQELLTRAQLPAGQTLRQQLSAATYARFNKQVQAAGLSDEMFARLKPSVAAIMLEVLVLQNLGFTPGYGVDQHFFKAARQQSKTIVPLESVETQIALVTDFSPAEGEMIMKTSLADMDQAKQSFGEVLQAWQSGDAVRLEKLLQRARGEAPAIFQRLVTDRNQRWVPKIESLLGGEKNAIIIVGAGHLVGSDGLIALLSKKGHKMIQQ
jgi:uncharacterized protein